MNGDLIAGYVLLYILTIAAAVMVPAAVIGWWRDRQRRAAVNEIRDLHVSPESLRRMLGICAVCGHGPTNHDRYKHHAAGIPIPEENTR